MPSSNCSLPRRILIIAPVSRCKAPYTTNDAANTPPRDLEHIYDAHWSGGESPSNRGARRGESSRGRVSDVHKLSSRNDQGSESTDYDTASEGGDFDDDYDLSRLILCGEDATGRTVSRGSSVDVFGQAAPLKAEGHPVPEDAATGHWRDGEGLRDRVHVRGPEYLKDRRKVQSAAPVMECVKVDLFSFDDRPYFNIAEVRPESWLNAQRVASAAKRRRRTNGVGTADEGAAGVKGGGSVSSSGASPCEERVGEEVGGTADEGTQSNDVLGRTSTSTPEAVSTDTIDGSMSGDPWTFVFQFMNPGPPYVSIALYFRPAGMRLGMTLPQLLEAEAGTPFGRTLRRFISADKKGKDAKMKAIIELINAPWALRQVIPRRPVILGKKVQLHYHQSADHFEVDLELSSSPLCERIYRSLKWCSKHSTEQISLMIEAQEEDELPEVVLGSVELMYVDEGACTSLPPLMGGGGG